ncbi:poly-beta-1,6 N-acetyl-D-glucosamine export porin PgaA [Gluconobacter kondonii]|uniref:poly-beta-1,6 N-acetyl-D-glucosamine export porin PgaA n=1 Tax=Gluconobacter kondonii TaxID=941463 RepID=UPI001B8CB4C3|nr:poly-beta-1,6 N-acetyl-D-glucosamine export porin PgaA [Gluconobacter kondonii]MBS1066871.1 poly-beta-1,6 N-acetyl-D-glucosamine export porin PgaA [Gluconobacter kondonii]
MLYRLYFSRHLDKIGKSFFSFVCLCSFFREDLSAFAAEPDFYDTLIIKARHGDCQPILNWLQNEQKRQPLSDREIADEIEINAWIGHDSDIAALWPQVAGRSLSVHTKLVAARAYRNLKQWQQALALFRQAGADCSSDEGERSQYLMTLADANFFKEALAQGKDFAQGSGSSRAYLTLSYIQKAAGLKQNAWQSATKAYSLDPHSIEAGFAYLDANDENRVIAGELVVAAHLPLSSMRQRQVELAQGAEYVRNALIPAQTEKNRFVLADRTLSYYQGLLLRYKKDPNAKADLRVARIDRLGGLLARYQMRELISEYKKLKAEAPVPAYAQNWVATAYLYLRQPVKAAAIWEQIINLSDRETVNLYFTALVESDQLRKAKALVAKLEQTVPYQTAIYGLPTRQDNDQWLDVQQMRVTLQQNQNRLSRGRDQAEHLAGTASTNQELAVELAGVYIERGWPRKAEDTLKRAEYLDPSNIGLESQQGLDALELQDWRKATLLTRDVIGRMPENETAQRVSRALRIHNMMELEIEGDKGINSNSPVTGAHDFNLRTLLYSMPLHYNWRVFAGVGYNNSNFEEGTGTDRVQIVGVEYRNRNNWVSLEGDHHAYGHGDAYGGVLSGWHDFDDHWRLGGSLERLGEHIPLRALRNNVTGSTGALYVLWRENEKRQVRLDFADSRFSDSNNRQAYNLLLQQRIFSSARWILDFSPSISSSHNTARNTLYYNPHQDLAILPSITAQEILYRRYEMQWSQTFEIGEGVYVERGYPTKAITNFSYGQNFQFNDALAFGASVIWDKRPYDGERQRNLEVSFNINYRF